MAKKKPKPILDLSELNATEKIRYGRAVLTVECWVSVRGTRIGLALQSYRRDEASAEDVAWAFVGEQVISHTSSFKWPDADLGRLLPRVSAVVTHPKLQARTPTALISELEKVEKRECELWEKARKQIQQSIAPKIPKLGPGISADLLKIHGSIQPPALSNLALTNINKANQELARSLMPNQAVAMQALRPKIASMETLSLHWDRMNETLLSQARDAGLGINISAYQGLLSKSISADLAESIKTFGSGLHSWQELARQVADAAKEADSSDIAGAVEDTAVEASVSVEEQNLEVLFERLDEISSEVKKLNAKNSPARAVLLTVAGGLILYFIKIVLAAKYGIQLGPPE